MPNLLSASRYVDSETDCMYRYCFSKNEYFGLHYHDYYEVFLTLRGDIVHLINGERQYLKEGSLLFIRPDDIHTYEHHPGDDFYYVNLTFTRKILHLLFEYLSDGFPSKKLLESAFPPVVLLDKKEKLRLFSELEDLNMIRCHDKKQLKYQLRVLLVEIFRRYFYNFDIDDTMKDEIPPWLESVCEQMKKKKNFVVGMARMIELSGKSREHLARNIKKYYHVTLSEFVNDIRLNYVANMLLNSDYTITDLCYASGFKNISWFYTQFKNKYGVSPKEFQKGKL